MGGESDMATILVTGGTGCIGSVTIYKLLQEKRVEKIYVATRSNNIKPLQLTFLFSRQSSSKHLLMDISDY